MYAKQRKRNNICFPSECRDCYPNSWRELQSEDFWQFAWMQPSCTMRPLEWRSRAVEGATPTSCHIPPGAKTTALSSAAQPDSLSSYSSACQEFIWIKFKESRPLAPFSRMLWAGPRAGLARARRKTNRMLPIGWHFDEGDCVFTQFEFVSSGAGINTGVLLLPIHTHGPEPDRVWMSHTGATPSTAQRQWGPPNPNYCWINSTMMKHALCLLWEW